MDFLECSSKILHDAQVWPPTPEKVCCELTATYNYLFVKINSLICDYKLVSSKFSVIKTNEIILTTLKRVYRCISDSDLLEESSEDTVSHHLLKIVKVLENPVFHFKSLTILGRLLLLVIALCLNESHVNSSDHRDTVSCLVRFTEMAGIPVLKEECHYLQGLLLASPLPADVKEEEVKCVVIEDMVSLFLVSFQHPANHLVMGHQPWEWLYRAMKCCNLITEKSHAKAMQELQAALKQCVEPRHKCRLLCLFADCYFQLGYSQLAIQTYKDALQTDVKCYSILHQLSVIYRSLDMPELELESLNLCVMALADEERNQKDKVPVMETDELVWSTILPIAPVSFIVSTVTFAKRCLQLKRYPEAAEQYSSLIRMLQQDDLFLLFEKHESNQQLNIAEVLVEAAEVLLITQQYQECIKLCNHARPSLSADDTLAKNSQMFSESHTNIVSPGSSQSGFLSLLDSSQNDMDNFDPLFTPKKKMKLITDHDDISANLSVSLKNSRKRLRSGETWNDESVAEKTESLDDILMARLLLCKADALVLSSGFTDDAVHHLQQAMDVLLCNQVPVNNRTDQPCKDASSVHSPHPKRQRICSDGKVACPESSKSNKVDSDDSQNVYTKLLIDTALRMANASLKRKRFSSVINCCRVVEQLDNGNNMNAMYMKTHILSANGGIQRETIGAWLNCRGVTYLCGNKEKEDTIKKLQEKIQPNIRSDLNWWNFSENDFLELDTMCLKHLLDIPH